MAGERPPHCAPLSQSPPLPRDPRTIFAAFLLRGFLGRRKSGPCAPLGIHVRVSSLGSPLCLYPSVANRPSPGGRLQQAAPPCFVEGSNLRLGTCFSIFRLFPLVPLPIAHLLAAFRLAAFPAHPFLPGPVSIFFPLPHGCSLQTRARPSFCLCAPPVQLSTCLSYVASPVVGTRTLSHTSCTYDSCRHLPSPPPLTPLRGQAIT